MQFTFYCPELSQKLFIPLVSSSVKAGFPSPADDYIEQKLDLNELIIKHPAATFFVRVEGNSMKNAGICHGDILVVDRAADAHDGKVAIVILDGEFTVKRIKIKNNAIYLIPENPDFPPIKVDESSDFQIWGIVTHVIHKT